MYVLIPITIPKLSLYPTIANDEAVVIKYSDIKGGSLYPILDLTLKGKYVIL